jgi:hypothetical protein
MRKIAANKNYRIIKKSDWLDDARPEDVLAGDYDAQIEQKNEIKRLGENIEDLWDYVLRMHKEINDKIDLGK